MLARLPKWASTDRFMIEAKGPSNATKDQFRLMMQSLLSERFQLKAHFESREASVYALTLAKPGKLGPNLRPHSEGPPCPATADVDPPKAGDVFPPICENYMFVRTRDGAHARWGSRNSTMASLASMLPNAPLLRGNAPQQNIDRPVVDRTGLSGAFDFTIEYALSPEGSRDGAQPDLAGTEFLDALREQLGVELKPANGQVQMLIVDHVERPSEN
jgi:bla regulator protein blaR1